jgi:hypothetical protein
MGFHKDNIVGQNGEYIIYNYLSNHSSTINLIDVSKDKWFQQFDIDFIQVTKDEINKIEVKTDRIADRTGNMVYEIYSDKRFYTLGCFEKTEADYIFYYLINTNILYIFDTQELREWVLEHQHNLKLVDMGDFALGYIIKLNDLKDISIKIKL